MSTTKLYSLDDLTFLHRGVSQSDRKFYSETTQAAGLFAITPSMVAEFGVPQGHAYYANLLDASIPYNDFRFEPSTALRFILDASKDVEVADLRLRLFMQALLPYAGKLATQNALLAMKPGYLGETASSLRVRFCAALQVQPQVRSQPYIILLSNLLRAQYARGIV